MPEINGSSMINLMMARRLMLAMRRLDDKLKHPHQVQQNSKLDEMEEDELQLSGNAPADKVADPVPEINFGENVNIKISDLLKRLDALRNSSAEDGQQAVEISFQQEVKTEISVKLEVYEHVDGLVVRNQNLAETDQYKFEFLSGDTFKITDKSTGKSTTIWGDPHVDTSDEDGINNGDFQDLKGSKTHTTFMLRDNTRITFTARDEGLIQKVDIFKGSQHLGGIGAESKDFKPETGLFASKVDENASSFSSTVPTGDTVYAGGDGNDWFSASHELVWGKTTGLLAGPRPDYLFDFSFQQSISQQLTVKSVNLLG
jgi:hypothetical protein